ncbi:MAG: D-glycero-beta-D-manno-heptose-7-phosphate kinase [Melioribacteraceae bacterium]|nr:D-glycero-beta-D-manno-heptose-7-phosphate kinase [Melioribacteraceae bacterium]MCF8264048.1 D-glycero-beta-D-manno-heptose-7-phosphate kinase [Melioribacteraceae bacterium]MCF8411860.1 D-glycero-beta-D-manno-heptose-7-phosphate kinase [Melioribacteraceae bacterium]MCF8431493.1 D-glycero-beta-D-manno-heptose-7-phosphate kinase [Melioribacteraceae bacterium]
MINFTKERLEELGRNFEGKTIAIIGDMMLDGYIWGDVNRISPEAPVPVVEVEKEFFRFGGAANCAYNILTLSGNPLPIGVIGNDSDGEIFASLMFESGINPEGIIKEDGRPTTSKFRVIADGQHVVRLDKESKSNIQKKTADEVLNLIRSKIDKIDAFILQDYNKGVLSKELINEIIAIANNNNKIITVDPKFHNFYEFKNVTVFKPNRKESEDALGMRIKTQEQILNAGNRLKEKLNPKYLLLTLGSEGIALFKDGEPEKTIPTKARNVADVSGAGDTVISTLTIALSAGATIEEATYLANYAAGIVCEEVGIIPIEKEKLFDKVLEANDE